MTERVVYALLLGIAFGFGSWLGGEILDLGQPTYWLAAGGGAAWGHFRGLRGLAS